MIPSVAKIPFLSMNNFPVILKYDNLLYKGISMYIFPDDSTQFPRVHWASNHTHGIPRRKGFRSKIDDYTIPCSET